MTGLFNYPKRRLKKLIKEGEYDQAVVLGTSLEPDFAEDHDFMFIMGSIYMMVDDARKALPYFEKAFELDGHDVENLTLKTNAHLALNQKEDAMECCRLILKLRPAHREAGQLLRDLEDL